MRLKKLQGLPVMPATGAGDRIAVQTADHTLVLDWHRDGAWKGRYCMDLTTGQYGGYREDGNWNRQKLCVLLGYDVYWDTLSWKENLRWASEADRQEAKEALDGSRKEFGWQEWEGAEVWDLIQDRECAYQRRIREKREDNRILRESREMRQVPELPEGLGEWMFRAMGCADILWYSREAEVWTCSACGGTFHRQAVRSAEDGRRARDGNEALCPGCGARLRARTRVKNSPAGKSGRFMLIQRMGGGYVVRYGITDVSWRCGSRHMVDLREEIRGLYREVSGRWKVRWYYENWMYEWSTRNCSVRTLPGKMYLYAEGLEQDIFAACAELDAGGAHAARVIVQAASAGVLMDYDALFTPGSRIGERNAAVAEYLLKGRFLRLLGELGNMRRYRNGRWTDVLDMDGATDLDVFRIRDRQKINRIRAADGDSLMVEWMQYSDLTGDRVPDETLAWMEKNRLRPGDDGTRVLLEHMSARKAANYLQRQMDGPYRGLTADNVARQYADYMDMCVSLGKDVGDEMVYRPRDLKLRHREAAEECRKQQVMVDMVRNRDRAADIAEEMREKYPGAEAVLAGIRDKYAYSDGTYRIVVPETLAEIALEGYALHHCAGSSGRYFERIMRRETYIVFLRREEKPEEPFYTIEVEPGGTIRQHRGLYDEEPGIEGILPFLRRWQQEIRGRIGEEDRALAAESARKREENIRELKEKRNTRVLEGLIEDFMEAEDAWEGEGGAGSGYLHCAV